MNTIRGGQRRRLKNIQDDATVEERNRKEDDENDESGRGGEADQK
jgi:hypothetical protein